ncbi:hypothetical protein M407DRAFT_30842 [Tulasnella calospora MUT 4182]|uniref:Uncharacterized protein n=1 Tax=Tulasnella calospora MUT 4182 TaxID=1051891 RepID=A0A0C3LDI2_9AGAM|nr:hypothetical protein M407DRAFT_30842 [Tulasnella calospora MUT 4182]
MRPITNNTHHGAHGLIDNAPIPYPNGVRLIVEQEPFHAAGPLSEDRGERAFQSPLECNSDNMTNLQPHTTHSPPSQVQSPTAAIATQSSTFTRGPLPELNPSRDTRSSIRNRDAADAFLGISQRTSRQLEDSLERGMIGSQLEGETGLSPWLDFNALGTRTKLVITVVILGIVLVGAVVKLVQTIHPPTSSH